MEDTKIRYEVKKIETNTPSETHWKVWDNEKKIFITDEVPEEGIANEICKDFNMMVTNPDEFLMKEFMSENFKEIAKRMDTEVNNDFRALIKAVDEMRSA